MWLSRFGEAFRRKEGRGVVAGSLDGGEGWMDWFG